MTSDQNQNQPLETPMQAAGAFIWDMMKILIIAVVIIIPFRIFIAEPFVVSGASMLPNFHNHDYLIVDRVSYFRNAPERGDVIVLKFPKDPSQFFIKRVIGLPGETIKIQSGYASITNKEHPEGFRLYESYLPSQQETLGRPEPVTLGSNEYFVLGDNRTASSDSRVWGILPEDDIIGKVWLRVYPFSTSGFFNTPTY